MRIIVTGARGFIGSVLALRAAEIGHDVLALDDESRGLNDIDRNLTRRTGGSLWYERHDCQGGFSEVLGKWGAGFAGDQVVDAVVHLAAGTGSLDRPIDELRALNVEMTKRVYDDARAMGAKVFAFPTTSLGLVDELKDSPYVLSKEEAFEWLKMQTDPLPLPFRFFNVIGSYKGLSEFRRKEVHIIPKLVDAYLSNRPFIINGTDYNTFDGTPSRSFVHVLDVVKNVLFQTQHVVQVGNPYATPAKDGAYWIGPSRATTVKQVIEVFEQFVGRVETRIGPRRAFDVGALYCDNAQTYVANTLAGGLVPAWVGIRDEALTLIDARRSERGGFRVA